MQLRREWRESILNSIRSVQVSRKVMGREGVSYHIRLIVTLNKINGNLSI